MSCAARAVVLIFRDYAEKGTHSYFTLLPAQQRGQIEKLGECAALD